MNTRLARYTGPFGHPTKAELCDEIDRLRRERDIWKARWVLRGKTIEGMEKYIEEHVHKRVEEESAKLNVAFDALVDNAKIDMRYGVTTRDMPGECIEYGFRVWMDILDLRTIEPLTVLKDERVALMLDEVSQSFGRKIYDKLMKFFYTKESNKS